MGWVEAEIVAGFFVDRRDYQLLVRHLDSQALPGIESRYVEPPVGQLRPRIQNERCLTGHAKMRKGAALLKRLLRRQETIVEMNGCAMTRVSRGQLLG